MMRSIRINKLKISTKALNIIENTVGPIYGIKFMKDHILVITLQKNKADV